MSKRLFDLIVATAGLLALWPLFVAVALIIKIDSPGPVFFRQERVGRGFSTFTMLKFRTMATGADGPLLTAGEDPRITRVGHVLRRTKIDELPQLINVVKGEMSLVGPRPEVPRYVHMFRHEYESILRCRPGLTDPASLEYRDEAAVLAAADDPEQLYIAEVLPHKLALSRTYAEESSLWLDLRIILRTLKAMGG